MPLKKKKKALNSRKNANRNNYYSGSQATSYYYGSSNGYYAGSDSIWNFHRGEEWSLGGGGLNLFLLAIWAGVCWWLNEALDLNLQLVDD